MSDLADLTNKIIEYRDARDWKQFHNPKDMAISLALESAEVLEHFQWKTPDEIKSHLKSKKTDVAEEVADVLYWVLLIAHDLEIDLQTEFDKKMSKNEAKYPVAKAKGNHIKYSELS